MVRKLSCRDSAEFRVSGSGSSGFSVKGFQGLGLKDFISKALGAATATPSLANDSCDHKPTQPIAHSTFVG